MRLPGLGSVDLLQLPARTLRAWQETLSLVPRLIRLVGDAEDLIGEIRAVAQDAHASQRQAQQAIDDVRSTRRHAHTVTDQVQATVGIAADAVAKAQRLTGEVQELLAKFRPALTQLAPLTEQLANSFTAADVSALLQVLRAAPTLLGKLETQVLPVVQTLDSIAPDVREILAASEGLGEMVGSVPGMGKIKKRIQQEHSDREPTGA